MLDGDMSKCDSEYEDVVLTEEKLNSELVSSAG